MQYTDEQKSEAVKLYLEVGPDEAARQIGCSRRSIYGWLGLHNVQAKTNDQRRKETYDRIESKRAEVRFLLADQIAEMLHRQNEPHEELHIGPDGIETIIHRKAEASDCKSYATAAAILIDKLRLELGESTARTETVTLGLVEAEIQKLESELGNVAPGNP